MSQTVEDIVAKLRLDNAQFLQAIKDTNTRMESLEKGVSKTGSNVDRLGSQFSSSMEKMERKTRETSSEVEKLNTSFGKIGPTVLSVVSAVSSYLAVSKLAGMAKDVALVGARYETLAVVMSVVGRNAGISAGAMEDNAKSLQRLGIIFHCSSRYSSIPSHNTHNNSKCFVSGTDKSHIFCHSRQFRYS